MKVNLLITGPPGCGKTTVLQRAAEMLEGEGLEVGGIVCPEIRERGRRKGFEIVDLRGERGVLSHVSLASSDVPRISRYGVNLRDVERISKEALSRDVDLYLIDEIGPMEMKSPVFRQEVGRILDLSIPVVAAIHQRASTGFAGEVKSRDDVELVVVTPQNRDSLPDRIREKVKLILGRGNGS